MSSSRSSSDSPVKSEEELFGNVPRRGKPLRSDCFLRGGRPDLLPFFSEVGLALLTGFAPAGLSSFSLKGDMPPLENDKPLPLRPCLCTASPISSFTPNLLFFMHNLGGLAC
uniref:Uncharacterized protein n=1 Tax=Opuntia streptacantha TaxID=393608 RepID=A0A7C9CMG6_OPUST